ncbi:MAG: class I SAM-dependent methyltransferase [Hyphomicrobiaceae bacterium]
MSTYATDDRLCPSCERDTYTKLAAYSHPDWPVVRCTNCDFVYLRIAPNYEALEEDLAWEKTAAKEAKRRKSFWLYRLDYATRFRLKIGNASDRRFIMQNVAPGGRVLDIGCGGSNRIPEEMVPFGIEISKGLAQQSDPIFRRHGGYVVNASAMDGLDRFEDNFFDRAILRSYLEHELKPRVILEKLHRKLKVGGTAVVKVPDFDCIGRHLMGRNWCGFRYPDHQNYFTHRTLAAMAAKAGLQCELKNVVRGLNDNLYAVLTKPAGQRRAPSMAAEQAAGPVA